MNYKTFNLGDWIGHISGEIEDETTLDGNEMRDLVEFLSGLPKWIPVSERLPKPYEQVLRTVKSIGWNGTFHIHVDIGSICPIDTDVIAWMPLPKPMRLENKKNDSKN